MLYQDFNSRNGDYIKLEKGSNLSFPPHIHSSFEVVVIVDGELNLTVNNETRTLKKGGCALIFPNQIHELETTEESKHLICIFSSQLVRAYSKQIEGKIPVSNIFELDSFYIDKLDAITNSSSASEIKGILYSICAEFDKTAEYINAQKDKKNLLLSIFKFIEENFSKECSLYTLAQTTSYNYVYLSKLFTKHTKMSYTEYVNRRRINEACYLLANTSKSMLDIAYECGFDCLRSFNRNFKRIIGVTPSSYLKGGLAVPYNATKLS